MRWIALVAICLVVSLPAHAEDWGVRRDPFDPGVVRRYKAILARDPHDAGALRQLIATYKRYRTVDKLETEFREQLGKAASESADGGALLVVLARMPRTSRSDTIELWNRALKARPTDARAWLALGELVPDPATASDAFKRAVEHAATPKLKQLALQKLVGAARSARDFPTLDATYGELIALAPKDGKLWLERGSAQLDAGRAALALDSFIGAESLFKTDPERRLTAMMNQGLALERLDRIDDAIAQYERTLDKLPRGFHLGREVVGRIIEVERKRKRLGAAVTRLEKRWPERARGHYEWDVLGDLYKESGNDNAAIDAYTRALAKAPTEVVTQRKLIALLDKSRPGDALVQHEAAARIAPGDSDLQLELAKRYVSQSKDKPKAMATLARLAKRSATNVNVRRAIADLYIQWEELPLALGEYEAIAKLEPHEADNHIILGETYVLANEEAKALIAWRRLETIGTAAAHLRHGDVLSLHQHWLEAADAYTKSLERDGTNVNAWRGRARAYDSLQRYAEATDDARRAVALIGQAGSDDGMAERYLLIRVLGRWHASGEQTQLTTSLAKWRFAFDRGDVAAGYLLAAHHARIGSHQQHGVLVELYRRRPDDDALGITLARSYARRQEWSRAREHLERVGKRNEARREEVVRLIAQLDEDRARAEADARWGEEGNPGRARQGKDPDIVGRHRRTGSRLSLGTDVRAASGTLLGIGLYRSHGVAPATALTWRFDWTQRDGVMESLEEVSFGISVSRRLLDTRKFEVAAGIGPRFEIRYDYNPDTSAFNRGAIGGDVTLELLPRALPTTLGLRFHQSLTDAPRSSALLLELALEVR